MFRIIANQLNDKYFELKINLRKKIIFESMIESMQIAIDKIIQLSKAEQKELVNLIEQELKWQNLELKQDSVLEELAGEAIEEFSSGNTKEDAW